MNADATIGLICAAAILFSVGFWVGEARGKQQIKHKAIEAGIAKYIVDERTGSTQFVFITNSIPIK